MENDKSFKLCITMAGAVSAGAYTAGVMDYLLETLDLWEKAKGINRSKELTPPQMSSRFSLYFISPIILLSL